MCCLNLCYIRVVLWFRNCVGPVMSVFSIPCVVGAVEVLEVVQQFQKISVE